MSIPEKQRTPSPRTFRAGIVPLAGCLALAGFGWGCREERQEPVRLLDHVVEAKVERTGGPVELPKAARWAPALGAEPKEGVARVRMALAADTQDHRVALLAPAGTSFRFGLTVPGRHPVLSLGLGYLFRPADVGKRVGYRVVVEHGGAEEVLLDEARPVVDDGRWWDREIDLQRWAGEEIGLSLRLTGEEGEAIWGAWSAPEIRSSEPAVPGDYDVILVSIDTLRADGLGVYGNPRPTSPHLDRLAEEGIRFDAAISQAPWTRPSHRAIFTGLYPNSDRGLKSPSIAWMLREAGYRTGAFTGGGQVHPRFGFALGFERYVVHDWLRDLDLVTSWLEEGQGRRDFVFLHTFEVHDPYDDDRFARELPAGDLAPGFSKFDRQDRETALTEHERRYVRALYDGDVAFTDERLGELLEWMRSRGSLDRTLLIVTSDHGEQFWEHGSWRHGMNVYEELVRVPLLVRLPPGLLPEAPAVVSTPVRLTDLYPTILDLLGVPLGHEIQGRSLRSLLEGTATAWPPAFSENTNQHAWERKALREGRLKLIQNLPRGELEGQESVFELYDLGRDPGETNDLTTVFPERFAELREQMGRLVAGVDATLLEEENPEDLPPELREQLRALGYLGK